MYIYNREREKGKGALVPIYFQRLNFSTKFLKAQHQYSGLLCLTNKAQKL